MRPMIKVKEEEERIISSYKQLKENNKEYNKGSLNSDDIGDDDDLEDESNDFDEDIEDY